MHKLSGIGLYMFVVSNKEAAEEAISELVSDIKFYIILFTYCSFSIAYSFSRKYLIDAANYLFEWKEAGQILICFWLLLSISH